MKIMRLRWVIMRKEGTEIFCGLARDFNFKPVDKLGDTAIKTYLSRRKAIAGFASSWGDFDESKYQAVEVLETIAIPSWAEVGK